MLSVITDTDKFDTTHYWIEKRNENCFVIVCQLNVLAYYDEANIYHYEEFSFSCVDAQQCIEIFDAMIQAEQTTGWINLGKLM